MSAKKTAAPARSRNERRQVEGRITNPRAPEPLATASTNQTGPMLPDGGGQVSVTVGGNENLGDFNHLKLLVTVTRPCAPNAAAEAVQAREAFKVADGLWNEFRDTMMGQAATNQ